MTSRPNNMYVTDARFIPRIFVFKKDSGYGRRLRRPQRRMPLTRIQQGTGDGTVLYCTVYYYCIVARMGAVQD